MEPTEQQQSRVTHIVLTNKNETESTVLRKLKVPGTFDDAGGVQTLRVEELSDESGTNTIKIQEGEWQFSNDGGATTKKIGSGGGQNFIPADFDDDEYIAAEQSPAGSGDLTLTGDQPDVPRKIVINSPNDCSSITLDITGTDETGATQNDTGITGPNAGEVETTTYWSTVTQISVSGACSQISIGLSTYPDPLPLTAEMLGDGGLVIEVSTSGGD